MTAENGQFVDIRVAQGEALEVAEMEKQSKIQDLQDIYAKCCMGCKCEGARCEAAGLYHCKFCLKIKRKKCGVAKCVAEYASTNCDAVCLPQKPGAPAAAQRKKRKADADPAVVLCDAKELDSDEDLESDEEEAPEWAYAIGHTVEVLFHGEYAGWFAGVVREQKMQGGNDAYYVEWCGEDAHTWVYPYKDEIRISTALAALDNAVGDGGGAMQSGAEESGDSDDDTPLGPFKGAIRGCPATASTANATL
jgi:hypothetical protein